MIKHLGAKWDGCKQAFFVTSNMETHIFRFWIVPPTKDAETQTAFKAQGLTAALALTSPGAGPSASPRTHGKRARPSSDPGSD